MERLKSVLADKIIDLSEDGGDNVKLKMEKVHAFRNFATACQTLIERYPAIEDELVRMVQNNDFDTKVASSRVDTVIRLAQTSETNINADIAKLKNVEEAAQEPVGIIEEAKHEVEITTEKVKDFFNEAEEKLKEFFIPEPESKVKLESENTDNEFIPLLKNKVEEKKEYADYEEVTTEPEVKPSEPIKEEELPQKEAMKESEPNVDGEGGVQKSKKDQIKKVLIACGVIMVGIILYVVGKWFYGNWSWIRWTLLGILVVAIAIWVMMKRKKE